MKKKLEPNPPLGSTKEMNGWLIQGRRNTATDAREEARAELETHGQAIIATKGHRGVRERPEPGA